MADGGCCEFCANYAYDEEDECYYCEVNLDEDEMYRFLSGSSRSCPYFQMDDEYKVDTEADITRADNRRLTEVLLWYGSGPASCMSRRPFF